MARTDRDIQQWPPGTLLLDEESTNQRDIVLQPQPTSDPNDPLNWEHWRKYLNFGLTCLYVLLTTEFLCAATPTWGPMHEQLGFSWAILNNSYALGCGFLAIGAVLLTPPALKLGRRPLYIISTIIIFAVSIWSAKMTKVVDLMLVNVFSCLSGALSEVMVQMTIADMFFVHERGLMNSIFIWTAQIGASLGALVAGFVTSSQGWRWVWWWNSIFFGASVLLFSFFYEETKYIPLPVPLEGVSPISENEHEHEHIQSGSGKITEEDKTKRTSPVSTPDKSTDQVQKREALLTSAIIDPTIPQRSYLQRLSLFTISPGGWKSFLLHSWHPFIILATFPAVLFSALAYGVLVALQNTLSTTMSSRMTLAPYNFSADQIGLMNMAPFIGVSIASMIVGSVSDRWIVYAAHRNQGVYEPETRLWILIPFIPFVLAGALIFGIGIELGLAWPVIAVGTGLCQFGGSSINIIVLTYITDSYNDIVGDALVGVTFIRNAVSTAFIFALDPWFNAIGIRNVVISMAVIATFVLSFVAVFLRWGKWFRARTASRYRRYALFE
ncbi:major facilitator superfamily domain-containing protein [Aspergillus cavernicola]|uniref:Major facilitator superfamily domain-containing protein n=1 Tax=Aspergillus cavernicola TaxID=176166 RepID=A0ABR4IMW5_9EURO